MISNENKSDLDLGLAYDLQMKLLTVMNGYEGKVCAAALAAALGSMLSRVASDDRQFVLNTVTSRAKNISDILVSARN